MTAKSEARQAWGGSFWVGGVSTLLMLLFGFVLKRWLPLHFAMGIAGFVGWFVGFLIYARRSPPKYGIPAWLAALITGAASGLCIGVLSYFFPW